MRKHRQKRATKSGITDTGIPHPRVSSKPAQTCKTQKQKTARSKAGAVPGSTVRVGQKHRKTQNLKKMTAAIHFTGVIPGGSGVKATRGYVKTKRITSAPTSSSPPITPPLPEQRRTQETVSRPAHAYADQSPRNPGHGESSGQSPRIACSGHETVSSVPASSSTSKPQNNTPFARRLQYDGALSISASSSTACFARWLCQFPLEAAPGVISQCRPADRRASKKARGQAIARARSKRANNKTGGAGRQDSTQAGNRRADEQNKKTCKQTSKQKSRRADRRRRKKSRQAVTQVSGGEL